MDGLIYASSMMMLNSAPRKVPVPALASWLLGVGIAATLAANVAHGLGYGLIGAVAACPQALVGSYDASVIALGKGLVTHARQHGIDITPPLPCLVHN